MRASLLDDQRHILAQLVDIAAREKPDCVVIAGDVYDRPVVPAECIELLSETLASLVLGLGIPVIAIAGNHDSPERLSFGDRLFAAQRLHIAGAAGAAPSRVTLTDAHGPVHFYSVPWIEPAWARHVFQRDDVPDHAGALSCCLDRIAGGRAAGERSVLVAHAYVSGASESDSERKPIVGGGEQVPAALLDGFSYVALGHLHRPQSVGSDTVRYSGSPLAYSFDEREGDKCIKLVDLAADGSCSVESIGLSPKRRVRTVRGELVDLANGPAAGENPDDYVRVVLPADHAVLEPYRRLQEVYPNLHLEFEALKRGPDGAPAYAERRPAQSELELFASFYQELLGVKMPAEERAVLEQQLAGFETAEREAAP